jgi:L-aminopeptidase/D-esterase-like protein
MMRGVNLLVVMVAARARPEARRREINGKGAVGVGRGWLAAAVGGGEGSGDRGHLHVVMLHAAVWSVVGHQVRRREAVGQRHDRE